MKSKTLVPISGNTYPVRREIKALGGKWDPEEKAWMVPEDKADQCRALVANSPKTKEESYSPRPRSRGFGARGGKWNGCAMGCREGNPNPRCRQCCFDEFDN